MINALSTASATASRGSKRKIRISIALVTVIIVTFGLLTVQGASAATTTCTTSGASGTASLPATFDAGATSSVWLLISNSAVADIELKVDSNQCVRQLFAASALPTWKKFDITFTLNQGTRQLVLSSFSNAASVSRIAVVNDGMTPTGDGSNLTPVTKVCANSGVLGTMSLSTNLEANASSTLWILSSNSSNADLELKIDNAQCQRQTFGTSSNLSWKKFNDNVSLNQGTRQITVSSFSNGVYITKLAVVSDGQVPVGDGSNVIGTTTVTTTIPVVTTKAPVTTQPTTTKAPTTAPPVVTTKAPSTVPPVVTTKAPIVTTTTKGLELDSPPVTNANWDLIYLNSAIAKMKVDHNLASIKQFSYVGRELKGRAYFKYNGWFHVATDFTATINNDGNYTVK